MRKDTTARKNKIVSLLREYKHPIARPVFIDRHIEELGMSKTRSTKQTLLVYLNHLAKRGIIQKKRRGKTVFISLPAGYEHEPTQIMEKDKSPIDCEILIEAFSKISKEFNNLDDEFFKLVDEKRELRIKRDKIMKQIYETEVNDHYCYQDSNKPEFNTPSLPTAEKKVKNLQ